MHDLLIKGGRVADGTGAAAVTADVAVKDGRIAAVGRDLGPARRTVNADGLLVTPGFVDIHTHYDGQATWDGQLAPSIWHGISTVVMGNCGVGFAPAARDRHDWLIGIMEGVEDIPGSALSVGLKWDWESFPQYLDALERLPRTVDVAAQVAHVAVRAFVMKDRVYGEATEADLAAQQKLVREALQAGAFGVSTSRSLLHRDVWGELVPGTFSPEPEMFALANAVREAGHGVFELTVRGTTGFDAKGPPAEMAWMRRVARDTGVPITFLCGQSHDYPEVWRHMMSEASSAAQAGEVVVPQVFGRPTNYLFTFKGMHPFSRYPSFKALAKLPWPERLGKLRDPAIRAAILADEDPNDDALRNIMRGCFDATYPLDQPLDYEPNPKDSIGARAKREGRDPKALAYDLMLARDGTAVLYFTAFNYAHGDMEAVREMLEHPNSVLGGGDGGAHVSYICDASMPTFMLTHWVRDRTRGPRVPLEWMIHKLTEQPARFYGFQDRGRIAPGQRADLNLIDMSRLALDLPTFIDDLPAGATRLMQTAQGYVSTMVAGEAIQENGRETGARPGKLVRAGR